MAKRASRTCIVDLNNSSVDEQNHFSPEGTKRRPKDDKVISCLEKTPPRCVAALGHAPSYLRLVAALKLRSETPGRYYPLQVSDLEHQLFSNNIETKSTPSYSSVLKKPAVSDSSVLLIESKDGVSNNNVVKSLPASINPANLKICIDKTKLIKNGAAVYCRSESDRIKLEEALKTSLESKYRINPSKKLNPRLIIKNVCISEDLDSDEKCLAVFLFLIRKLYSSTRAALSAANEVSYLWQMSQRSFLGLRKDILNSVVLEDTSTT
ncbi:unnamed protein product [Acanthoscelides obtectus]|uniref:Uncharacterized protein n=1 Tax=Acanthoscelides obtectus TaxID=200917 RepID=A0A9P0PXK1_ACAOB|nr:unnamed protein product [Acanthoscelides obtectus]CAK1647821.1 hypothetical protein AOBTE_LOCUS15415 [Acanthoscelides obtectus]